MLICQRNTLKKFYMAAERLTHILFRKIFILIAIYHHSPKRFRQTYGHLDNKGASLLKKVLNVCDPFFLFLNSSPNHHQQFTEIK